jgi:hypothetical protein
VTAGTAGVIAVALLAGFVAAYPTWSARNGNNAVWVADDAYSSGGLSGGSVLDYDDDRILVHDGRDSLVILDRRTGEPLFDVFSQQFEVYAALVPDGVVHSDRSGLEVVRADGSRWEVPGRSHMVGDAVLVAADVEAGHVVAAVRGEENPDEPTRLVAYALDDAAIRWEVPDVGRAGFTRQGEHPAAPPGFLRQARLYPVVLLDGWDGDGGAEWSMIDTRTGDVVEQIVTEGVPLTAGEYVVSGSRGVCAELTLSRLGDDVPIQWPDGVADAQCDLVRAISPDRMYVRVPAEAEKLERVDDLVRLFHIDPGDGVVTELDWQGRSQDVDGLTPGRADASRSWGGYFYGGDAAMYNASTGSAAWELDDPGAFGAWSGAEVAVVTSTTSSLDRLVTDATDSSLWYHLVDVHTGERTGGSFLGRYPVSDVAVLDHGQALVLAGNQIVLLE